MSSQQLDEEAIFHIAREIPRPEARSNYLEQACAGDRHLRERVEALLGVHEQEQEFLKSNRDPSRTVDQPEPMEAVGQQIGRYKLLQQIGEGGFGIVYMAEQHRPVRRKVALKVIKPGMDTGAVIARFEAERQALAMMDHPNISRVLDGGATDNGRPYFVMELVKGVPITEYCDKNQLSTKDRLELFITVCQAVQHAHQKGVIHRDIKPSNILVTLHDGQPVVKVIDFGVAKAINQQLTEKTLFTAYGQMVGTPQYMSPEQAEMSGLDVDTRSDIYSLGVLLYELLTGTPPLDAERLRTAGFAEIQRIIQEDEPPKPSTRLSSAGDQLTIIAKHRGESAERLHRILCGDLDWIVMKALDKDRNRRYDTAKGLINDIVRHLNHEPVDATPPSTMYRVGKFIHRNRMEVLGGSLIAISLMTGLIASVAGLVKARREREAAQEEAERANLVSTSLTNLIATVHPTVVRGSDFTVRQMLDDFASSLAESPPSRPDVEGDIRCTIAAAYKKLGQGAQAELHLRRALELRRRVFGHEHVKVAECLRDLGVVTSDIELTREALEIQRRLGVRDESLCWTLRWMCWHLLMRTSGGHREEAEEYGREALAILRTLPEQGDSDLSLQIKGSLALCLQARRALPESIALYNEVISVRRKQPLSPNIAWIHADITIAHMAHGDYQAAESHGREAVRIFRACSIPAEGVALYRLARALHKRGKFSEAEAAFRRAGEDFEIVNNSMRNSLGEIAALRDAHGDVVTAEDFYRQALESYDKDATGFAFGMAVFRLARLLQDRGNVSEAQDHLRNLLSRFEGIVGFESSVGRSNLVLYCLALANLPNVKDAELRKVVSDAARGLSTPDGSFLHYAPFLNRSIVQAYCRLGDIESARHALAEIEENSELAMNYRDAEATIAKYLREHGRADELESVYRDGLSKRSDGLPQNHADIAFTKQKLATLLIDKGCYDEAEPLFLEAYHLLKDHPIAPKDRAKEALGQILELYKAWDKPDELAKWRAVSVD